MNIKGAKAITKFGAKPVKIAVVFGTRPDMIKMAPVIKELRANADHFTPFMIHTGQHKQLSRGILPLFGIRQREYKSYRLETMRPFQKKEDLLKRLITKLGPIYDKEKPSLVLVQGDTETAFAAAICAFFHKIPVAHVEAGLRTYNRFTPYPEEAFRSMISRVTSLNFAPTDNAAQNLRNEHIPRNEIFMTGNTVVDAVNYIIKNSRKDRSLPVDDILKDNKEFILFTCHRSENIGEPMKVIFDAVKTIALKHPEINIVYPVHLNPAVKKVAHSSLKNIENIHLIKPGNYLSTLYLLKKCKLLITDSGGLTEEGTILKKPTVLVKNITERKESVESGWAVLAGIHDTDTIVKHVENILSNPEAFKKMVSGKSNIYGKGDAAKQIVERLIKYFHFPVKVDSDDLRKSENSAVNWLIRSGIQDEQGRIKGYYRPKLSRPGLSGEVRFRQNGGEYPFIYPEIIGYAICTFLQKYKSLNINMRKELLARAITAADSIDNMLKQAGSGLAVPARIYKSSADMPDRHRYYYGFDNGTVLKGLVDVYRITKEKRYLETAEKIAAFLMNDLKMGKADFYSYFDPITNQPKNSLENWSMHAGAFHAKNAEGFLRLFEQTKNKIYYETAVSLCENALKFQRASGRFITEPNEDATHAHPHCYAAEGLLATGIFLLKWHKNRDLAVKFMNAASKATMWLLDNQLSDGGIRFMFRKGEFLPFQRSDATAQTLRLGSILMRQGYLNKKYFANLSAIAGRLRDFQHLKTANKHINGGIRYGENETGTDLYDINAWSTIFTISALDSYQKLLKKINNDNRNNA